MGSGWPQQLSGTVWRLGVCHRGQGLRPRTEVQQEALFTRGWVGPEATAPGVAEQGLGCRELGKIRLGMWL